jgi:hypothetical protein
MRFPGAMIERPARLARISVADARRAAVPDLLTAHDPGLRGFD